MDNFIAKYIPLTQGKQAMVDDENFEWLSQYKWYYVKDRLGGYAVTHDPNNHNRLIHMHRLLNDTPAGFVTDHINHDKLDNRRSNLRTSTCSENALNARSESGNASGYRGVTQSGDGKKWQARIMIKGKSIHLGLFADIQDAIRARNQAKDLYT